MSVALEYLIIEASNIKDLEEKMNEASRQGWRVMTTNIGQGRYVATLERRK